MSKRLLAEAEELQLQQGPVMKRRSQRDSPTSSSADERSDDTFFDAEPAAPPSPPAAVAPQRLGYAAVAEKGARAGMEDTYAAAPLTSLPGTAAYGVFDGHGGAYVAEYCSQHLLTRIDASLHESLSASTMHADDACASPSSGASDGTTAGAACSNSGDSNPAIAPGLRAAFAAVDAELAASAGREAHLCGTTAAVCLVTPDWLYTANTGDSRVVLVRKGGPLPLTIDHCPTRNDERERIGRAGGSVIWQNGYRVMGALSMTRAIGDHFLRSAGVIPDPEISAVRRRPADDEFLLLATDGLFNFVSCVEAVAVARRALARAEDAGLPAAAAAEVVPRALARLALARGGSDNVTVVFVDLRNGAGGAPALLQQQQPVQQAAAEPKQQQSEAQQQQEEEEEEGAAAASDEATGGAAPMSDTDGENDASDMQATQEGSPEPPAADTAAAAAAAAAEAASLALPRLNLPPLRTRLAPADCGPASAPAALPPPLALGPLSAAAICRNAALAESTGPDSPPSLEICRAQSAPVHLGFTVTTGGPVVPPAAMQQPRAFHGSYTSQRLPATPLGGFVAGGCLCGLSARTGIPDSEPCSVFCSRFVVPAVGGSLQQQKEQ